MGAINGNIQVVNTSEDDSPIQWDFSENSRWT